MSLPEPGHRRLARSAPEEQGVSSRVVADFVRGLVDVPELHSVMVVRHGAVIAEGWSAPYGPHRLHEVFSLSKSFTATAVGFARAEGLLDLDDLVLDVFPERAPAEPSSNLRRMRLRDLLTMTTGHDVEPDDQVFGEQDWVRAFLALPVVHEPGSHFLYNTPATAVLAATVQKVAGERVLTYLGPRLLEPLGIVGATWERSPTGVDAGGFGLSVTTEDLACFGQLYLQGGRWAGATVLPEGWVDEATWSHVSTDRDQSTDWGQGYGYQFWRCRHDGYRGDGAFGQFCVVLPDQDLVVVITSGVTDMQAQLTQIWDRLLPGLSDVPLARDEHAHDDLLRLLASLRVDPPPGAATSRTAERVRGRTITFEPNAAKVSSAVLEPGPDRDRVSVRLGLRTLSGEVGHGAGAAMRLRARRATEEDVLVSGVWTAPDAYAFTVRFVESPFVLTAVATFSGDDVAIAPSMNVSFGRTRFPALVGHLEP